MRLQELIKEETIVFDIEANEKNDVILNLANVLKNNGLVDDVDAYYQAVLERESYSTTGIGMGIAIPHGKSSAVKESSVVVGRVKEPVEWNSLDGNKVHTIFLLAIANEDRADGHLQILAELAGSLMDDDFVAALNNAKSPEDILDIVKADKGEN